MGSTSPMALRICSHASPSLRCPVSSPPPSAAVAPSTYRWASGGVGRTTATAVRAPGEVRRAARAVLARSSMEAEVVVGKATEVNKDTFWPIVKAAAPKIVVLDMYTQWCGPCKVMAPKFQQLSEKYLDVVFLKLDCNHENRPLAKELGLRVVPTFKIFKDCKLVKEVTGAKFDDLALAIETARAD